MAVGITLNNLASLENETSALTTINDNNAVITTAFADALSVSGTSPNQMNSELDMNSFNIINLPAPATVNSPVRLADVAGNPTITVPPTGTSGATVPFLNGANVWTGSEDFTGSTVTAHTQTAGDNSTKVATTAYVQSNIAGSITGPAVSGVATTVVIS